MLRLGQQQGSRAARQRAGSTRQETARADGEGTTVIVRLNVNSPGIPGLSWSFARVFVELLVFDFAMHLAMVAVKDFFSVELVPSHSRRIDVGKRRIAVNSLQCSLRAK